MNRWTSGESVFRRQPVAPDGSVRVLHVAAMLSVDPIGDHRRGGRGDRLDRREVSRVDDRRPQAAKRPEETRMETQVVPRLLSEVHDGYVRSQRCVSRNPCCRSGSRRVAIAIGRQPVDQVHQTVLHPADVEPVDDVSDERASVRASSRQFLQGGFDRRKARGEEVLEPGSRRFLVISFGEHDDPRGERPPEKELLARFDHLRPDRARRAVCRRSSTTSRRGGSPPGPVRIASSTASRRPGSETARLSRLT